jgi:cupin 2 domain-containing protein
MHISRGNLFSDISAIGDEPESFEPLIKTRDLLVERIVTKDNFTPPGQWFDQQKDEWVVLFQGKARIEFEKGEVISMKKGDFIFISAHQKHRVIQVSSRPNCKWLAIHGNLK